MNRIALITALLFSLSGNSLAQQPTLEWTASFYKPYSFSYSMSKDNLGNIFISGYNRPYGEYKFLTLKFNTSGSLNWSTIYQNTDSISSGIGEKCITDGLGNVYVSGSLFGIDLDDIFLIKYNNQNNLIWSARYNGSGDGDDRFSDMVMDKYSNIYITGTTTPLDFVTLKYDSTGTLLWEAIYNNNFNSPDFANAIAIDSSGNVYITGYSGHTNMRYKYTTVKYNQSGIQQWVAEYSTNADAEAMNVGVDKQNNIYVTGSVDTMITPSTLSKYRTIKYDSSGNEIWAREFKRTYFTDIPYNMLIDSSNSPVIVGTSIVKYNSNGSFLWADTVSPGYTCALDKLNNLYVSGARTDSGFNWYMKTIKYSLTGTKLWTLNIGGIENYNYTPAEIVIDNNDIYIAANFEINGQNGYDSIVLFKYSQPIGITANNNQIPDRFYLYQNYPNPFNPSTKIKFDVPANANYLTDGNIELIIFDLLGKEMTKLISSELKPGKYEYEWNASNFSSGIYFYTLKTNSPLETKKMLLIK